MNHSVACGTFTVLCDQHPYLVPKRVHRPKGKPVPIPPWALATTTLLSVSADSPSWTFYIKTITRQAAFCVGFSHLRAVAKTRSRCGAHLSVAEEEPSAQGDHILCIRSSVDRRWVVFILVSPAAADVVRVLISTRVCKPSGYTHEGPASHSWFFLSSPPSPDHCLPASHLQGPAAPCPGTAGLLQAAGRHVGNRERVTLEPESPERSTKDRGPQELGASC